jgi:hypothetical protein
MKSQRLLILGWALAAPAAMACSARRTGPVAPAPPTLPLAAPRLLVPDEGAIVPQSPADLDCAPTKAGIRGNRIAFSWGDGEPSEVKEYEIVLQHVGSLFPVFTKTVTEPHYVYLSCGTYINDQNLGGWEWKVRAVDKRGSPSDWSPARSLSFAPCRIGDESCFAVADRMARAARPPGF